MITNENKEKIMNAVRDILEAVGEDVNRPGLVETPKRVANMYEEMFAGLYEDPKQHLKLFDESSNDEIVIVRDIPFASMCEHHLLPFVGKAHIAYIPSDNKIIGLSKLARIVDNFAKKPQVQERLTNDVANFLNDNLNPKGVAVIIEAEHMCMSIRGARASGSKTQTSSLRGLMRNDARTRAEVLSLLTK
jgi:GTP cyclohydrolase I